MLYEACSTHYTQLERLLNGAYQLYASASALSSSSRRSGVVWSSASYTWLRAKCPFSSLRSRSGEAATSVVTASALPANRLY
jgi:hypothetical protein